MAEDLREVEEIGVNHVMRLFFRHATVARDTARPVVKPRKTSAATLRRALSNTLGAICDENAIESLEQFRSVRHRPLTRELRQARL